MKVPVLAIALLLASSGQQAKRIPALDAGAEFPPQDYVVWWYQRDGALEKLARQRLAEAPATPETVRLLVEAESLEGLLVALRRIVDTEPHWIADAFEALGDAVWRFRGGEERMQRNRQTLQEVVAAARKRLPELPREPAARAERVFVTMDAEFADERSRSRAAVLSRFVEQYPGTEAALLAEVDAIDADPVSQGKFDALDRFIAAHPGTTAAAKALYLKGSHWHSTNTLGTLEPRDADPTDRFMRVHAIAEELESGRYPRSEWVEKAPSLVFGFFVPDDVRIEPKNIDRLLSAYQAFARTHFVVDAEHPARSGVGYMVTKKMADLFERKGERVPGVERVLADRERTVDDPSAVRYLRALFYMEGLENRQAAQRDAALAKTRRALELLSAEGTGLYSRRALATLAALEFAERNYAGARAAFRKYATLYPQSGWAWVATLRTGQCEEELGDWRAAADSYLEAAERYTDLPLARVLAHEYGARAYEALGEFDKALATHQRALDGWDNAFGLRYSTHVRRSAKPDDPFSPSTDIGEVRKESLSPRIAQLKRSLSAPGGALVERGRWLLGQRRYAEAAAVLQRMLSEHPRSPVAAEAHALAGRARLEHALELVNVERADEDEAAAVTELQAIGAGRPRFAAFAARLTHAVILWKRGGAAEAERLGLAALRDWLAHQTNSIPTTAMTAIEADVVEIRNLIFRPSGDGLLARSAWRGFQRAQDKQFFIVGRDVTVKLADGEPAQVDAYRSIPAMDNVLFLTADDFAFFDTLMVKLGGRKRRQPSHVMEVPNQPAGESVDVLAFLNRFLPVQPGHWGGWMFQTFPMITQIEFTNAERTRAAARVTIEYEGATVLLEKEGARWVARAVVDRWIT